MLHDVALYYRNDVGDTITRVQHNTCVVTFTHERQNSLGFKQTMTETVVLKDKLSHFLSVLWRVECGFGDKDARVRKVSDSHLLLEGVLP
jgi:hypothetical protein